jgi:hypothetical protein
MDECLFKGDVMVKKTTLSRTAKTASTAKRRKVVKSKSKTTAKRSARKSKGFFSWF